MSYTNRFIQLVKEMDETKEKLEDQEFYLLMALRIIIFAMHNHELSNLRRFLNSWQVSPNNFMLERTVQEIQPNPNLEKEI